MIDIHCHIFPNVDDGSGNMNDSIEMAVLAAQAGTKGIVVTPHCNIPESYKNHWATDLKDGFDALCAEIARRNIPIKLYPGQEIFLSAGFMELLNEGQLIPINWSKYLLVEFDARESAPVAYRKLQQIIAEGYIPIVAHPERYEFVREESDSIYRIKDIGGLIQINRGSLNGSFGYRAMNTAMEIVGTYQADFVASDAHSQYSRTPYLADAHELICEKYSADYADLLLKVNPQRVLENKSVYNF